MRNKIFSILLSLCMMLTMMPAMTMTAFAAAGDTPSGNAIYSFDFETDPFENGWTTIDKDGDGYDWKTDTDAFWDNNDGIDGGHCASSYDEYRNANNWLFSPAITIPADGAIVSWYEKSLFAEWQDSYEVYICETNTEADPSKVTKVLDSTYATINWSQHSVELKAADYGGKTVYIAFRHYIYDYEQYALGIDNFAVASMTSYAITNGTAETDKDTNHGYISIDKESATKDETVTVTVKPGEGYALKTLTVVPTEGGTAIETTQDQQNAAKYTFKMPAKAVTVTAAFAAPGSSNWEILTEAFSGEGEYTSETEIKDDAENPLFKVKDSNGTRTITLLSDITAGDTDTALEVPSGKEIVFDLNGHVVDRALTSSSDGGSVIVTNGKLTINDSASSDSHSGKYADMPKGGVITGGNTTSYGGGIILNNFSTVIMNGGTLTDCTATNAGGVYIGYASFTMNKGSAITNCHVTKRTGSGGGILLNSPDSECTIADATITGNTGIKWADYSIIGNDIDLGGGNLTITGYCTIGALFTSGKSYTNNAKTKITFDNQGGTGGLTEIDPQNYNSSLPQGQIPTREGYEFQGYYDASAGGTQYINKNGYCVRNWDKIVASATLYAHWEPKTYHIYLYDSDYYYYPGSYSYNADRDIDIKYDETMPIINPPTRYGYYFNGYWDETSGDSGERVFIASGDPTFEKFKLTRDLYLKACWESTQDESPHIIKTSLPDEQKSYASGLDIAITTNVPGYTDQNLYPLYSRPDGDILSHHLYYRANVKSASSKLISMDIEPYECTYEHGVAVSGENELTANATPLRMRVQLPTSMINTLDGEDRVYVKHVKDDGTTYYEDAQVHLGNALFVNKHGFSEFNISTEKYEEPQFSGHSLFLGGEIGLNFYMTLPDAYKDGQMKFEVSGKGHKIVTADGIYCPEQNGMYRYTLDLNAIQMADKVTATFTCGDYKQIQEYSIQEYLKEAEEEGSPEMEELAKKMCTYGHYSQQLLGTPTGTGSEKYAPINAAETPNTLIDLSSYTMSISDNGNTNFTGEVTRSLVLDTKVGLKLNLTLSSDSTYESNKPSVTVDGEELDASNVFFQDGKMVVDIENIPATMLGHHYVVVVDGDYTVTVAPLSYAAALMNEGDDNSKYFAAALYDYYKTVREFSGQELE